MRDENKRTILLVEDEIIIAMSEKMSLEKYGYDVITADSGEEALEVIKSNNAIDLILMDIDLGKGINGPDAATTILEECDIPVIFLSNHTEPEVVEKTEKITSYGYVVKNSGITVLDASIKMAFKLFNALKKEKVKDEALRESEKLFLAAFDMNPVTVAISTIQDGRFLNVNNVFLEMFSFSSKSEIIGKTSVELGLFADPHDRQSMRKEVEETGRVFCRDLKMVTKDGRILDALFSAIPILVGNKQCLLTSALDITERKRAEAMLVENEMIFNQFVTYSPALIYVKDDKLRLLKISKNMEVLLGKPASELIGKDSYDLVPPEFAKSAIADDLKVLQGSKPIKVEEEMNGRVYSTLKYPLYRPDGQPAYLAGFSVDITEHKQTEKLLRSITERLYLATSSAKAGVWDWNLQTNEMVWDDRMHDLYGLTHENFPGGVEAWKHGLHPDDASRAIEECEAALVGQRDFDTEFRVLRPNGTVVYIKANGLVLRDETGKPLRMIGLNIDITERKQAEENINSLLAEKELILKEVHHRIKNNITFMESVLSLQADSTTNIDVKAALQGAITRIQSMRILYDKLLIGQEYSDVSIKNYIESLIDAIVAIFPERGKVTIEKQISDFILNTKLLIPLGIILNELLTNIFKHAFEGRDGGTISIILDKTENHVTLSLQDNGKGIAESVDFSKSPMFGLAIVKMLTKQLKGTYTIENNNGTRSVLEFEIYQHRKLI